MLTLSKTSHSNTSTLLNSAFDTFEHYGFENAENVMRGRSGTSKLVMPKKEVSFVLPHEKRLALMLRYCLSGHCESAQNKDLKLIYKYENRKNTKKIPISLHIMGTDDTLAEITIISTINSFLKKVGVADVLININSVGDKESKKRYFRELASYMRSVQKDLPPYAKPYIDRRDYVSAYLSLVQKDHPVTGSAPNSMEYLNDESRVRFREILEYMDYMGINYEIDSTIIGSEDCWSHSIFEVRIPDEYSYVPVARGGRFNSLARRAYGKSLASAGAVIEYEVRGRSVPKKRPLTKPAPKFFIAHLGEAARMKIFSILDEFHHNGITVAKSIAHSNIGDQIKDSEKLNVPYLLIIGHKEALEDTVIVRNTKTRIQKVIPISQLTGYVTRLKV